MIPILSAMLLGAAPAAGQSFAGMYEINQMEMAGGLELQPNGRFRYALEYGAASEQGEGNWTFDGKAIRLTSNPMPKAPTFELMRDDPAPKGQVWMRFDKGFNWTGRVDAIATAIGTKGKGLVTATGDGRVDSGGKLLTSIEPLVPIYATPGGAVRLDPNRGHRLLFRFHPNDVGKPAFRDEALTLDGKDLIFYRFDTKIRFVRVNRGR
jgi:hypothetical protein